MSKTKPKTKPKPKPEPEPEPEFKPEFDLSTHGIFCDIEGDCLRKEPNQNPNALREEPNQNPPVKHSDTFCEDRTMAVEKKFAITLIASLKEEQVKLREAAGRAKDDNYKELCMSQAMGINRALNIIGDFVEAEQQKEWVLWPRDITKSTTTLSLKNLNKKKA